MDTAAGSAAGWTHLADLVEAAAARAPDRVAIVDATGGTTLTWADLDALASVESDRLRAAGVAGGDRVAIRLPNGAAFCVALFGALRVGAVVVPSGPIAVLRELEIVFGDCRPSVVIAAQADAAAGIAAAGIGATLFGPPGVAGADRSRVPVAVTGGGEDIALLVYTSGTTGRPRGVRLSHRAVLANRAQTAALRPTPITGSDRVLVALPLFHVFGLAAGLLQACHAAATVVLSERLDPARVAEVLLEHRVTTLAAVPSLYRGLLELPVERLRAATADVRLCTSGGAPLPPRWLSGFRAATGLSIVEGYGLTETGPVVTSNAVDGVGKPGSVGRPLPGVELRLVDAAGRPLDLDDDRPSPGPDDPVDPGDDFDGPDFDPAQDTGLVSVRGPNLFSGYWPDGVGGPDADGWFRTVDVGFLDGDGDLHLNDRASDLVIVNGFNVYPREVEQVLVELPGVAEAAVVGVPDDTTGEAVKAVLVRTAGAEVTEDAVRAHCVERLARFKIPAAIVFTAELPRTPTGKVARRQLAGQP